jgi:hypothetical protein
MHPSTNLFGSSNNKKGNQIMFNDSNMSLFQPQLPPHPPTSLPAAVAPPPPPQPPSQQPQSLSKNSTFTISSSACNSIENGRHEDHATISNSNNTVSMTLKHKENEIKTIQEEPHEAEIVIKKEEAIQNNLEDLETLNDVCALKSILMNLQSLLINEQEPTNVLNSFLHNDSLEKDAENQNHNGSQLNDTSSSASGSSDSSYVLSNLDKDEQIAILRSKIQQLELCADDLRTELSQAKTELMNRNGMQSGLRTRLNEQNNTILEMKNEELKLNLNFEKLNKEKIEMQTQLDKQMNELYNLRTELSKKDLEINKMRNQLELKKVRLIFSY